MPAVDAGSVPSDTFDFTAAAAAAAATAAADVPRGARLAFGLGTAAPVAGIILVMEGEAAGAEIAAAVLV